MRLPCSFRGRGRTTRVALRALLLVLRADRFPAGAGGILRELPGALQELRRSRIVAGGAGERLGRVGKMPGAIEREAFGVGLRPVAHLRHDLVALAERLVDLHRLRPALDADGV